MLHNIYIKENDWNEDDIIQDDDFDDSTSFDDEDMLEACPTGNAKRNVIADYLV